MAQALPPNDDDGHCSDALAALGRILMPVILKYTSPLQHLHVNDCFPRFELTECLRPMMRTTAPRRQFWAQQAPSPKMAAATPAYDLMSRIHEQAASIDARASSPFANIHAPFDTLITIVAVPVTGIHASTIAPAWFCCRSRRHFPALPPAHFLALRRSDFDLMKDDEREYGAAPCGERAIGAYAS